MATSQKITQKCKKAADVNGSDDSSSMATGAVSIPAQLGSSLPTIQAATPSRKITSRRAPCTCRAQFISTALSASVSIKVSNKAIWMSMACTVNSVDDLR